MKEGQCGYHNGFYNDYNKQLTPRSGVHV